MQVNPRYSMPSWARRAIVSDIRGTTRDTIEDTLVINGILFRLIDTAGIRETGDPLEGMGIERSRQAAEKAQIIVQVIDSTSPQTDLLELTSRARYSCKFGTRQTYAPLTRTINQEQQAMSCRINRLSFPLGQERRCRGAERGVGKGGCRTDGNHRLP